MEWNARDGNEDKQYTIKDWAWFKYSNEQAILILPILQQFAKITRLGKIESRDKDYEMDRGCFDFRILRYQVKEIQERTLYGKDGMEAKFRFIG